ncbi:hypothetical protein AAFF_G00158260 [Aldrovandia affinis]|uniref:Uncharacterized protein n=1 Tax=Aldrovandia affinis TaxID=143900 RepID=A0AAD7W8H8_9TELE|nr:hypothetical protein AAFF_G00158260 [Aldrovandia affinis]
MITMWRHHQSPDPPVTSLFKYGQCGVTLFYFVLQCRWPLGNTRLIAVHSGTSRITRQNALRACAESGAAEDPDPRPHPKWSNGAEARTFTAVASSGLTSPWRSVPIT